MKMICQNCGKKDSQQPTNGSYREKTSENGLTTLFVVCNNCNWVGNSWYASDGYVPGTHDQKVEGTIPRKEAMKKSRLEKKLGIDKVRETAEIKQNKEDKKYPYNEYVEHYFSQF